MKYAIVEISGRQFWIEAGKYYVFKLAVTYIASGKTNYAFVGVIVNHPIPYPKPSIMYTTVEEGSNLTMDVADFYDFYFQNDPKIIKNHQTI